MKTEYTVRIVGSSKYAAYCYVGGLRLEVTRKSPFVAVEDGRPARFRSETEARNVGAACAWPGQKVVVRPNVEMNTRGVRAPESSIVSCRELVCNGRGCVPC
jgi:hypothetical protein